MKPLLIGMLTLLFSSVASPASTPTSPSVEQQEQQLVLNMADTYDTTSQLQSNLSSQYQNTPSLRPFIAQLTNIMNTISNPEISPTQLPSLTEKYTDPATQNFLHEVVGIYNPVSLQNLDQTLFTKNTTNAINSGEKTLIVTNNAGIVKQHDTEKEANP